MRITFTRDKEGGDRHSMRMDRDDGTSTWSPTTQFFVEHDLMHYAVETTLPYRNAFWGLVSQGWEVSDFEERQPGSRKVVQLPEEAYLSECLVSVMQVDVLEGPFAWPEFQQLLLSTYGLEGVITEAQLFDVRAQFRDLVEGWRRTPAGLTFVVSFDATSSR